MIVLNGILSKSFQYIAYSWAFSIVKGSKAPNLKLWVTSSNFGWSEWYGLYKLFWLWEEKWGRKRQKECGPSCGNAFRRTSVWLENKWVWPQSSPVKRCIQRDPLKGVYTQLKPAFMGEGDVLNGISSWWWSLHPDSLSRVVMVLDQSGVESIGDLKWSYDGCQLCQILFSWLVYAKSEYG